MGTSCYFTMIYGHSERGRNRSARAAIRKHMTWEYMVREFNVQDSDKILLLEEFLNETGKDGWELVSVATTPTANFTHLVYLKRPAVLTERFDLVPPPSRL